VSRRSSLAAAGRNKEPQGKTTIFSTSYADYFWQWTSCQWKTRNDNCQSYTNGEYSAETVAIDGRPHVARFEVRDGDIPEFGGGERAEIGELNAANVVEGDERWYGMDIKFPSDFTTPQSWFVLWQYHPQVDGSSPSVALEVSSSNGHLLLTNSNEAPYFQEVDLGALTLGKWVRYVVHVKWSTSNATGYVQVYKDGTQILAQTPWYTLYGAGYHYMKLGIYRSAANTTTAVIYHDNLLITAP
jgi:Polysaccharide lyase